MPVSRPAIAFRPPPPRAGRAAAFSLVEVMVASCVLMLGISGALVTLQRSLDSIAQARQLDAASQLMQTELERLRLLNWSQLQALQESGRTDVAVPSGGDFARFTCERRIHDLRAKLTDPAGIALHLSRKARWLRIQPHAQQGTVLALGGAQLVDESHGSDSRWRPAPPHRTVPLAYFWIRCELLHEKP